MKTTLILAAGLAVSGLAAQSADRQATVRIRKVENINGVERVTDTTFTTSNPGALHRDHPSIITGPGDDITIVENNGGKLKRIEISRTDSAGAASDIRVIRSEGLDEKEIEEALKRAGARHEVIPGEKQGTNTKSTPESEGSTVIIKKRSCGSGKEDIEKAPVHYNVVVVRKVNISEPGESDLKRLPGHNAPPEGKTLKLDKLAFFPNPSDGKFDLSFELSTIGDTDISIMGADGKLVYKEALPGFTGKYERRVDISGNPKGVYFLKVAQGDRTLLKKIALE